MAADAKDYQTGDTVEYTVTVVNTGNVPLTQVSVSDELTDTANLIHDLAPGEKTSVSFQYAISENAEPGSLKNRVLAVAQPSAGIDALNADADVTVNVVGKGASAKILLPASVKPGVTVKGTVTFENGGSKDLTGIKYAVEPEGATVSGTVKRLKAGASVTLHYECTITPYTAPSALVMGVRITGASGKEAVHLDAVAEVEVDHVTILSSKQEAAEQSVKPGKSVTYQVTLKNEGNVALTGLECATDLWGIVIDSESIDPADGANINAEALSINRLEPGASLTYEYAYPVSRSAEYGAFDNNLSVTGKDERTGEAVTSNSVTTVEVEAAPSLKLSVSTDKDAYAPGEAIRYTLTAENNGNVPLTNVRLRDLAEGLTLSGIDASDDSGATQAAGEAAVSLPELSSGASITAVFDGIVPDVDLSETGVTASGSRFESRRINRAAVSGNSVRDGTKVMDGAEATVVVTGEIALGIETKSDAEFYSPGETARVRVRVMNRSDATIGHIVLSNDQSFAYSGKNRSNVDVSVSGGNAIIALLAPGEDVTLTFEKAIPGDYSLPNLDVGFEARSAYVNAAATQSISVGEKPKPMLVQMNAVQPVIEAGNDAQFLVTVTNDGEKMLKAISIEILPIGGTITSLPDGAVLEGDTVRIDQLSAGETLKFDYHVLTAEGDEPGKSVEASVTASGRYEQGQGDALTASAIASISLTKPTQTPAPTEAPAPTQLPVNVLIFGIAALALLLAGGLIWLSKKRNQP